MDEMHKNFLINWGNDITLKELRDYIPLDGYKRLLKKLSKRPDFYSKFSRVRNLVKATTMEDLVFCIVVDDIHGFKCCKNLINDELAGIKQISDVYEDMFRLVELSKSL